MKKLLPLILLALGLASILGGYFFLRSQKQNQGNEEKSALREIKLEDRPVASLTPSEDGHWLKLKIAKIKIKEAASLDYELLYKLPDGRTQGVPGTIKLNGQDLIERDLLLGSESSGKFRYDEGVKQGTLTLRFRDKAGKLIAKFSTEFSLLSETKELMTPDGSFRVSLVKKPKSGYFVLMETFGVYESLPQEIAAGPYGLFSSVPLSGLSAKTQIKGAEVYLHLEGSQWQKLEGEQKLKTKTGIFIGTAS